MQGAAFEKHERANPGAVMGREALNGENHLLAQGIKVSNESQYTFRYYEMLQISDHGSFPVRKRILEIGTDREYNRR
jgi:hypothetical protein